MRRPEFCDWYCLVWAVLTPLVVWFQVFLYPTVWSLVPFSPLWVMFLSPVFVLAFWAYYCTGVGRSGE